MMFLFTARNSDCPKINVLNKKCIRECIGISNKIIRYNLGVLGLRVGIRTFRLSPLQKFKPKTATLFDIVVVLDCEFGINIIIKYVISM